MNAKADAAARLKDVLGQASGGSSERAKQLLEALGLGDQVEITSDQALEIGREAYAGVTDEVRGFIDAIPALAMIPAKDLGKIIQGILRLIVGAASGDDFETDLNAYQAMRAKHRKSAFDAYKKAGFNEARAFELVLADIASMRSVVQAVGRGTTNAAAKSR